MTVTLTALYAGILGLIYVALGVNVTVHRVRNRVSLGDGGKAEMLRMVRIHGNAAEYIPIALVLMLAYEINGGALIALHLAGLAMVAGRLVQTIGMWTKEGPNVARGAGQTLTWATIAALAALNILKVL